MNDVNNNLAPYALPYVPEGLRNLNAAADKANEVINTAQDVADLSKPGAEGIRAAGNIAAGQAPSEQSGENLRTAGTLHADVYTRAKQSFLGNDSTAPDSIDKAATGFKDPISFMPKFVQQAWKAATSANNALTSFTNYVHITTPDPTPSAPEIPCYNCRSPR